MQGEKMENIIALPNNMTLKHSFPKLTADLLDKAENILKEKFGYTKLPIDYRNFLLQHNGGFVSPGYVDDSDTLDHTQEFVFDTPLKWARDNNRSVKPCIVMFFGIWLEDELPEDYDAPDDLDLFELIASNEHSREDFDVLPDNMMSIAKCSHPEAADMLCISLDETDYGSVFYYYDMWNHPGKFHGDYYEKKKEITNEHKRVPFVKVANSFNEFIQNCKILDVDEEE